MQAEEYLAHSQVWTPLQDRISGGEVGGMGDFTEGGIAKANDDDGDGGNFIMTTLAVIHWRRMAAGRQTVVYAVSKTHADNLVREFTNRGISAAAILSDTPQDKRQQAIDDFKSGCLTVVVNHAVITEGFDLPDASCVMITRPTKSLALYLQMVGRGLRRKDDGSNYCLILDLAGNAEEHGLPEKCRDWSLSARGNPAAGEPPVHHCHECNYMTHPAHHNCPECGADLGKPCPRCGKFRPWSRWTVDCPVEHEAVCDRCHDDIHGKLGIGRFNRNQDSLSYAKRAEEFHEEGNLEAALADYFFAIHVAKTENRPGQLAAWHTYRATVHAEMGNIDLAEADFSEAENICEGGGSLTQAALDFMRRERTKMYEELGENAR
ncbi:MAG: helicase-related protein [Chloroflexota bacterium]|nr:helicase-related protein [Chloroflexota bacterium]MDE2960514.1 helicase-related protein [Chloroflexota bacterium]